MHELAITQAIVDKCVEECQSQRVVRVVIEIGRDTCVAPDAVRFAFELCAQGTPVEGAELEIHTPPGEALQLRQMEVIEA